MSDARTSAEQLVEHRSRITIMDGEVITFATSFSERDGIMGVMHDAEGPFKVSASRNGVIIHRAELSSALDLKAFARAVELAKNAALQMSRADRGNFHD